MSELVGIIRQIIHNEMQRLRITELAVVEADGQHPHASGGDKDNYACDVRLKNSGLVLKQVRGLRLPSRPRLSLEPDDEVELWVNSHGAASAWAADDGGNVNLLGLKPDEFRITGWYAMLLPCGGRLACDSGIRKLSRHGWHCPECDVHLTSLFYCDGCNRRWYPFPKGDEIVYKSPDVS